ncbi:MAG: ABC transporter substrate-binding protein [Anaerolineales bacterium]|nr:ABC transporter substrate-binding protein [Anaerolineales bacterium]
MRKITLILSVLVLWSMLLSACGGGAQQEAAEPILIGGALALTGINAPIDEPAMRGIQLAVDELNAKGGILGRKVEFVNLDSKSDPVTSSNVGVQLVERGADAIIPAADFDMGGPACREAQKAGIVCISTTASSPLFGSEALGDKVFTLSMWNTTMGAATAEFAYKEKGWTKAWVVTDTFIDYTKSLSRYFIEHFTSLGGTVLFEDTYTQGAQDFSAQLARIQASEEQPDFIYVSSYMPDLGTIIRTIREAGIQAPIVGGDTYDDPGLFEAVGPDYGNEVYFDTHGFLSADSGPRVGEFMASYKAKFGKDPEAVWIMPGYDVVYVLANAMEKAGTTDGAAVAKVMEEMEFDNLTGHLDWSDAASGHMPTKAAALVVLSGGKPQFLGWVTPETLPEP